MTLSIMAAQPGGAYFITDGGIYDDSDVCIGIGRKVALFSDLNMAIGYTGYGGNAEWIEEAVARAGVTTQRAALMALPNVLRDLVARHGSTKPGDGLTLHAIAHDLPSGQAACFVLRSDGENMPPGYPPFALMRVQGWIDFTDPSAVLGRPVALNNPASFNVVEDGRKLAEAARLDPWEDGGKVSYHVAGFADLYSVGPAGLQRQRLCEWPGDRVGEAINPFKQDA